VRNTLHKLVTSMAVSDLTQAASNHPQKGVAHLDFSTTNLKIELSLTTIQQPPSIAKVRNASSNTSTLPIRLHGVVLS